MIAGSCAVDGTSGRGEISARVVIGADGVESAVGRWAGLDTRVRARDMESCAQYVVDDTTIDADAIVLPLRRPCCTRRLRVGVSERHAFGQRRTRRARTSCRWTIGRRVAGRLHGARTSLTRAYRAERRRRDRLRHDGAHLRRWPGALRRCGAHDQPAIGRRDCHCDEVGSTGRGDDGCGTPIRQHERERARIVSRPMDAPPGRRSRPVLPVKEALARFDDAFYDNLARP